MFDDLLRAIVRLSSRLLAFQAFKVMKDPEFIPDNAVEMLTDGLVGTVRAARRVMYRATVAMIRSQGLEHGVSLDYEPGLEAYEWSWLRTSVRRCVRVSVEEQLQPDGSYKQVKVIRNHPKRIASEIGRAAGRHVKLAEVDTVRKTVGDSRQAQAAAKRVQARKEQDSAKHETGKREPKGCRLSPLEREAARMEQAIAARREEASRETGLEIDDPRLDREWAKLQKRVEAEEEKAIEAEEKARQQAQDEKDTKERLRQGRPIAWARMVTGAYSCPFCLMLASRGPVYATSRDAGELAVNRYHDGCDCRVVPVFDYADWPGREQYVLLHRVWQYQVWDGVAKSQAEQRRVFAEHVRSERGQEEIKAALRGDREALKAPEGFKPPEGFGPSKGPKSWNDGHDTKRKRSVEPGPVEKAEASRKVAPLSELEKAKKGLGEASERLEFYRHWIESFEQKLGTTTDKVERASLKKLIGDFEKAAKQVRSEIEGYSDTIFRKENASISDLLADSGAKRFEYVPRTKPGRSDPEKYSPPSLEELRDYLAPLDDPHKYFREGKTDEASRDELITVLALERMGLRLRSIQARGNIKGTTEHRLKTPDAQVVGTDWLVEFKTIEKASNLEKIDKRIKEGAEQARNVVIRLEQTLTEEKIESHISKALKQHPDVFDTITIINADGKVVYWSNDS